MIKYLKIWTKVIKDTIDAKSLSFNLSICLVSYFAIYLMTDKNNVTSIILFILGIIVWQSIKLFIFYKELTANNQYDFVLLKPIHPLFGIILYHKDPLDIIVLIPVLLFLKIRKK